MRSETGDLPNRHTIAMGKLIRKAREEAGLTQEQLAEKTYRRKLAMHQMEAGKVEVNAWTVTYLAIALNKPITYFYPKEYLHYDPKQEDLTDLEKEMIIHYKDLQSDRSRKIAIGIVKLMSTCE